MGTDIDPTANPCAAFAAQGHLLFHGICVLHAFDILLGLMPGGHDLVAAAHAAQAEICAGAQAEPALFAAGVGLFHGDDVADANVHGQFPPLIRSQ